MAEKVDIFHTRMLEQIQPHNSARELVEKIVKTALEVEYGQSFTVSKNFARMVSKISDAIVTNPDLRRQALSVASVYIDKKIEEIKLRKNERKQS